MKNIEQSPIPPADSRHHRFALLVFHGSNYANAYQDAGFNCTRATAYVNGHRLSRKADVASYLSEMRRIEFEERTERTRQRFAVSEAERQAGFETMLMKLRR